MHAISDFSDFISDTCEKLARDGTADRAVLASISGMIVAASFSQGLEMGGIVAVEGALVYAAYRIVPVVAEKISRFIRGQDAMPKLPSEILARIGDLKGLETVAVAGRNGNWLVTEPGSREIKTMTEAEFAYFATRVAMKGGILNQVTVDEDAVRITRREGGMLNGTTRDSPAIITVHYSGQMSKVYSDRGRMMLTSQDDASFRSVPKELLTEELCSEAIKQNGLTMP